MSKNSNRSEKAKRAHLRRRLEESQKAGGGYNNDPGGQRQSWISQAWSSFVSGNK